MASLRACDKFLLLACGQRVSVIDYSCPDKVKLLPLPSESKSSTEAPGLGEETALCGQNTDNGEVGEEKTSAHNGKDLEPNRVLATDVSGNGQCVAVCDDQKYLHIFQHSPRSGDEGQGDWTLSSSRSVSRRCTVVRFTSDLQTILVGDKSGDVFSFPSFPTPATSATPATSTTSSSSSSSSSSSLSSSTVKPATAPAPPTSLESRTADGEGDQPDVGSEKTTEEEKRRAEEKMDTDRDMDGGEEEDGNGKNTGVEEAEEGQGVDGDEDKAEDGETGTHGELVLGHLSMLLDMILVDGDRYVVTSDRDEKIRISDHPDAFNIHAFCLGHSAFVITLACDDTRKVLFSGSGDVSIGVWGYNGGLLEQRQCRNDFPLLTGEEQGKGDVSDSVTSEDTRSAVQQISYCSDCSLLFVALYKCPDILMYRLTTTTPTPPSSEEVSHSLQPMQLVSSESRGRVVSLCVQGCVLWVVREDQWPQLKVEAFRVTTQGDKVMTSLIESGESSPQSRVLHTLSNHPEILTVPETWQDPIPTMWKSQIDGYVQEYMERKRQRLEATNKQQKPQPHRFGGKKWKRKKKSSF